MTTKDTTTEKVSPTLEPGLKILLQVEIDDQERVAIQCDYKGASSTLLLQSIAYMLDTAYKGDTEIIKVVSEQIPDIVAEYCRLKDLQLEVDKAGESLEKTLEELDTDLIKACINEELELEDMDMDLVMKYTSELMRRKVKEVTDDRTRCQEETSNSL